MKRQCELLWMAYYVILNMNDNEWWQWQYVMYNNNEGMSRPIMANNE